MFWMHLSAGSVFVVSAGSVVCVSAGSVVCGIYIYGCEGGREGDGIGGEREGGREGNGMGWDEMGCAGRVKRRDFFFHFKPTPGSK